MVPHPSRGPERASSDGRSSIDRLRRLCGPRLLGLCGLAIVVSSSAVAQQPSVGGDSAAAAQEPDAAQDPALAQVEHLREPRISARPDEWMLVVTARGDPNTVGAAAFGLVFQLYFSIPETPKGAGLEFPRARWPESLDEPKTDWVGRYALPVPRTVTGLPAHQASPDLVASLEEWEYGEVAEILHIGPYTEEAPTLERLREFVRAAGYVTEGGHEEVYVRGPTMTGPGDPQRYLTILRYLVRRR